MSACRSILGSLGLLVIGASIGAAIATLQRDTNQRIEIRDDQQLLIRRTSRDQSLVIEIEKVPSPDSKSLSR